MGSATTKALRFKLEDSRETIFSAKDLDEDCCNNIVRDYLQLPGSKVDGKIEISKFASKFKLSIKK
jgi:hypothetical protein